MERETQVEENHSHGHDYGDDMKDSNILSLDPKCASDARQHYEHAHVGVSGSGQWCTHRAVPSKH